MQDVYFIPFLLVSVKVAPSEVQEVKSSPKINWFWDDTWWPLAIRWFFSKWRRNWSRVNNNNPCLLLQTEYSVKVFFLLFSLSGRSEAKEREGPDCVPDVVSLCLSDHSSPLNSPFLFPTELLPCRPGPRHRHLMHVAGKSQPSHLHFYSSLQDVQTAPLFTADVPINYFHCW